MPVHGHNSRSISSLLTACALLSLATAFAHAGTRTVAGSEAAYALAASLRDRLEAQPAANRSRAQYEQVLDAFRAVYHRWPAAAKAPAAVEAVAELLAEQGRTLQRPHDLKAAQGQFEFLLAQYPDSPQVAVALLNEGELCANDLHDAACARQKLKTVERRFPHSSYAEQAALDLSPAARAAIHSETNAAAPSVEKTTVRTAPLPARRLSPSQPMPQPTTVPRQPLVKPATQLVSAPSMVTTENAPVPGLHGGMASGRTVAITGIRHWSNPVSTRIAIDLGGEVEYEAARVAHPDRIFFDLHGARLSRGLNGREVQVIDDGYLKRIRVAQYRPDVTRVVLDVTDVSDYSAFLLPNPWRLILDIHGGHRAAAPSSRAAVAVPGSLRNALATRALSVQDGSGADGSGAGMTADVAALSSAPTRVAATSGPTTAPVAARFASAAPTARDATWRGRSRANSRTATATAATASRAFAPAAGMATTVAEPAAAAQPTADGERSLVRALGLKVNRIVIDAGHGGHDSGTLGPGGIEEKDVVLDVALRTGRLLEKRIGAKVIYTRDDDTFVPLETRTAIANKAQADLFLSIHANSSPEPAARGVETYYLNFTTDPQALEVAARENAVSDAGVHQLSDLVRKIALKDKIEESREFAADVDASLYHGLSDGAVDFRDRGVKKAPFVVLIGAQMPSVLAEISFLTNPEDAQLLRQQAWRQRIAESLAAGVERYLSGLSSTRPMLDHASEQAQSQNGEEPAVDQR